MRDSYREILFCKPNIARPTICANSKADAAVARAGAINFPQQHPAAFHEQVPQVEVPPMLTAAQLSEKTKSELVDIAKELEVESSDAGEDQER